MTLIPVPGYGPGVLEPEGNLDAYIDNLLLHGHLFMGTWDPEGLLSTIPAIATTLTGVLAGQLLRSNRNQLEKTVNLFLLGSFGIVIGSLWNLWFPINKYLWTSSFVAFTSGVAFIFLTVCYYIIDIKKHAWWTKPFTILGMNAIAAYLFSVIMDLVLVYTNITLADGTSISLKTFIYQNYFASWAGMLYGPMFYALAYVILWLGIMTILYKRRIFIKV